MITAISKQYPLNSRLGVTEKSWKSCFGRGCRRPICPPEHSAPVTEFVHTNHSFQHHGHCQRVGALGARFRALSSRCMVVARSFRATNHQNGWFMKGTFSLLCWEGTAAPTRPPGVRQLPPVSFYLCGGLCSCEESLARDPFRLCCNPLAPLLCSTACCCKHRAPLPCTGRAAVFCADGHGGGFRASGPAPPAPAAA